MFQSDIYKGVSRPFTFKGISLKYLVGIVVSIVAGLISVISLSMAGHGGLGIALLFLIPTVTITTIYALYKRYGDHGLTRLLARRLMPRVIRIDRLLLNKSTSPSSPHD